MQTFELAIGETLEIGPDIRVTVLEICGDEARLRIEAPSRLDVQCVPEANGDSHEGKPRA